MVEAEGAFKCLLRCVDQATSFDGRWVTAAPPSSTPGCSYPRTLRLRQQTHFAVALLLCGSVAHPTPPQATAMAWAMHIFLACSLTLVDK